MQLFSNPLRFPRFTWIYNQNSFSASLTRTPTHAMEFPCISSLAAENDGKKSLALVSDIVMQNIKPNKDMHVLTMQWIYISGCFFSSFCWFGLVRSKWQIIATARALKGKNSSFNLHIQTFFLCKLCSTQCATASLWLCVYVCLVPVPGVQYCTMYKYCVAAKHHPQPVIKTHKNWYACVDNNFSSLSFILAASKFEASVAAMVNATTRAKKTLTPHDFEIHTQMFGRCLGCLKIKH